MKKYTGVIIARFQSPYLHKGHNSLIKFVQNKHQKLVVVLGVNPVGATKNNPYDFYTRERMLRSEYPNITVIPMQDNASDKVWSLKLDELLQTSFPGEDFLLYGSRNCFIEFYSGKFSCKEIPAIKKINATEIRYQLSDQVQNSESFRKGVNYALQNMFDKVYPTVDIAVFKENRQVLLLVRKPNTNEWRLPGGFTDPTDDSYESAAKRELFEECGAIEVGKMGYERSFQIDDWRYRKEKDSIMSTLFSTNYSFGMPKAADDIEECRWVSMRQLEEKKVHLTKEHQQMIHFLVAKYKN